MVNGQDKTGSGKLRIAWICHFMNQSIKERLNIKEAVKELAPWVTLGIKEIKKRQDIELHVIAPLYSITRHRTLTDDNVNYHFVKLGVPFSTRRWPHRFDLDFLTGFLPFKRRVKGLIRKIKPDLVNLIGAENAYYSSSALNLTHLPLLVTIQGFISLNNEAGTGDQRMVLKRISTEAEILKKMRHFGIEDSSTENYIKGINPLAVMHWFHLPFAKTAVENRPRKEYDLVFFARVTAMKGIEDLITAVYELQLFKPDITLEIIGNGDSDYIRKLQEKIRDLGLSENIKFRGFIPSQQEMHYEVMKARISVLPTYNDTIPGTIVESMLLGLPVISYKTGGIPDLNREGEYIRLVEKGDVKALINEITGLLSNNELQARMGEKARQYALKRFDNSRSVDLLINAYREVINDFKHTAGR